MKRAKRMAEGIAKVFALAGAAGVLAGSLMLLGRFLKMPFSVVSGRGWEEGGEEYSESLRRCCDFIEGVLASHKERLAPSLLDVRWQETELNTCESLLAEAEEELWGGLSGNQGLLCQKLRYCVELLKIKRSLPDYESLLSEFNGVLQKIKEEYYIGPFEEMGDVESYLEWMEAQGKVLEEMAGRLEAQRGLQGFYSEDSIEKACLSCEQLWGEEGLLRKGFEERLAACAFLGEEERRELLSRRRDTEEKLAPAFERLEEQLSFMQGVQYGKGLCGYPEGRAYYDYLLERSTGSGMNAEEMFYYLEEARTGELFSDRRGDGIPERAGGITGGEGILEETRKDNVSQAEHVLKELYIHAKEAYPVLEKADWELVKLPEDFFGRISKAFYAKTGDRNRIYVGEDFGTGDRLEIFRVLAHEGFPGHALSHNADRPEKYPALEQALTFPGYEEGWAVRAEFAAADWLEEGRERYRESVLDGLYGEIVLSQMDIGIHGLGWTVEELDAFAEEIYGEEGRGVGASLWNLLADNPCLYQPYAVGYCRLAQLEQKYAGQGAKPWEFAARYLECGQAPFAVAEEWIFGKK